MIITSCIQLDAIWFLSTGHCSAGADKNHAVAKLGAWIENCESTLDLNTPFLSHITDWMWLKELWLVVIRWTTVTTLANTKSSPFWDTTLSSHHISKYLNMKPRVIKAYRPQIHARQEYVH